MVLCYFWFLHGFMIDFANSNCFRSVHMWSFRFHVYIYISFSSRNAVITKFLDPLRGNLSQHAHNKSIWNKNLPRKLVPLKHTDKKKNINISLYSVESMSWSSSSRAMPNALVQRADLRQSVLSYIVKKTSC